MTAVPLVSVIMPVYNGEKYLREAIESILTQTFRDFEYIIVDDGSTDGTGAILAHYQKMDRRIRVACNPENEGQPAALNKGCRLAKGKYIARMDADDVSLPERLERQVKYLEAHPEIGVLGTWVELIDDRGTRVLPFFVCHPVRSAVLKWRLIFNSAVIHPSVMMCRGLIERLGFYALEASTAEDYDLWIRASPETEIVNLPHVLLKYRSHEEGVSWRYSHFQEQVVTRISHSVMTRLLGFDVSAELVANLRQSLGMQLTCQTPCSKPLKLRQIEAAARLLQQLYGAYLSSNCLTRSDASEVGLDFRGKLFNLAVQVGEFSLLKGLLLAMRALRSCPQPLPMRMIRRDLRTFVRTALMEHPRHHPSASMVKSLGRYGNQREPRESSAKLS